MAKRTMESTHRAGRTEANLGDVLQGLQQMVSMSSKAAPTDMELVGYDSEGLTNSLASS